MHSMCVCVVRIAAMQVLFSLGLLHTRISGNTNIFASSSSCTSSISTSSSRQAAALSAEMRLVREDMAWWMGNKPEVGAWGL